MIRRIVIAALLVCPPALAQKPPKRPPPACGMTLLPLQPGNSWTYRAGTAEVVVKVVDVVASKDKGAEIKIAEQYQNRTIEMTWTCSKDGLVISPESLFFAGEPGGGVGATLAVTARESVTLPADALLKQDYAWIHTLKGDYTRTPAAPGIEHRPAKIEIERHGLVHPIDPVTINLGSWGAVKTTFELRGRGIVEDEKADIPVKRPGGMWLLKGLGIIKLEDAFDKTWELAETNLPLPK